MIIRNHWANAGTSKIVANEPKPSFNVGNLLGSIFNTIKDVVTNKDIKINVPAIDFSAIQLPEAKTDIGRLLSKYGLWVGVAIVITLFIIFGRK